MPSSKFVYNQWDYGYREQPIRVNADFGGRGSMYGIGITDTEQDINNQIYHPPVDDPFIDPSSADAAAALAAQNTADNAAAQVVQLQKQLDDMSAQALQATGAVAASLQQQISDLSKQLSTQKTVAVQAQAAASAFSPYKKYLPYVAGAAVLVLIALVVTKK